MLSVWKMDEEGNTSLTPLSQAGVGAINVGCIDSPFDLIDQDNNLKGQILKTGVYLNNSRIAGSVQQFDMMM